MNKGKFFCRTIVRLAIGVAPIAVSACPLCDSQTGLEIRAGIFNQNFIPTLLSVLLPFAVLIVVLVAMQLVLRSLDRNPRKKAEL